MAHLGCGGEGSAVYHQALLHNLEAIRPSFLVLQPLSRNDGMVRTALDGLFAKLLMASDMADATCGARTMWQGAYPIPSVDPAEGGDAATVAVWQDVRSVLRGMEAAGAQAYDAASVIGEDAAPWCYRAECSDDRTHPNDQATELVTPLVRRLLQRMLGDEIRGDTTLALS
jgi:hypothetical protein